MRPELEHEIHRLKAIYQAAGQPFEAQPGASAEQIAQVEAAYGALDEDLKALWRFSNGSDYKVWFLAERGDTRAEPAPCDLVPLEDAFQFWRDQMAYEAAVQGEWDEDPERDARIQRDTLEHRGWFPIAQFNGYSTMVMLDVAPTEVGTRGQIIIYQHDPDTMLYASGSFLEFFRASNDLLEKSGLLD